MKNYCFIDWQNLYQSLNWQIDYKKFRIYLRDKYKIEKAYYFIDFKWDENSLYEKLQESGFILVFNIKWKNLQSNKKWNIDTNLVFNVMKKIIHDDFDKIVLVSGDWDYKMMIDYLIEQNRFLKVIVPNLKFASSLYKNHNNLESRFLANLDDLKEKLEYKK